MRNYKSENEWQKNKYDTIRAKIDKELGQKLRAKIRQENKTIASWIRENAKKYLEHKQ